MNYRWVARLSLRAQWNHPQYNLRSTYAKRHTRVIWLGGGWFWYSGTVVDYISCA